MPTADRWFITDQSSAAKTFRGREIGRRWSDNQPADNLRPLSTPIFTTFSISEGIGRIWGANFARAEFFVCNRNSICEIINKWFCSQNSATMTWVHGNIWVQQSVNQSSAKFHKCILICVFSISLLKHSQRSDWLEIFYWINLAENCCSSNRLNPTSNHKDPPCLGQKGFSAGHLDRNIPGLYYTQH